jgi:SNF2 family DNA or RNA helicase
MSNITQLQFKCPECGKKVSTMGEFTHENQIFYILDCGHFTAKNVVAAVDKFDNFTSLEGDKPYPFQIEGMKFVEANAGTALIADEMGLGKTIQGLGFLHYHPECRPVLIVAKRKLTTQWFKELYRWCDKSLGQIIMQGHAILPGLQYYIISMDLLRTYPLERLEEVGIKCVLIDEVQHIKNADSQRTHFLRKLISDLRIEHIIALSGTPFKNRVSEYFTILNILAPHYFNNREEFIRKYVNYWYDSKGKLREVGLKNVEEFRRLTSKFIIRRERPEVEDQIPYIGIKRNIQYVDLEGKFLEAYNNAEKEFSDLFSRIEDQKSRMGDNSALLAILQRMRHVVGLSKIPDTVEFVTDFLMSTDRKLILFIHHQDVAEMLVTQLNRWCSMGGFKPCMTIRGSMPDSELNDVVDKFNNDSSYRLLVASTLAAGEGLNLQKMCNEVVIVERQWNAANEEQAERRVLRIGQKQSNVYATYMTAGGTIDEMLTEINERKRAMVKSGMLSKDQVVWNESEMISQLADMIGKKRSGIKWKLN